MHGHSYKYLSQQVELYVSLSFFIHSASDFPLRGILYDMAQ